MSSPAPLVLDPQRATAITGGRWLGPRAPVAVRGAAIDSRQVTEACLFACLRGRHVDGHDYAETAVGAGASLVLAQRELDLPVPVVVVADVTAALGALAATARAAYRGATWIAVSGANGKTTCKELLRAACAAVGPAHATDGNRNNDLGVPLTILATPPGRRWVVVELGGNQDGDIERLAALVRPDAALLTSIGPAHLEGYGDLAGVARGEAAVFRPLPPGAPAGFGAWGLERVAAAAGDDPMALRAEVEAAAAGRRLLVVGDAEAATAGRSDSDGVHLEVDGTRFTLPLHGQHNVANAALVLALTGALGIAPATAAAGMTGARPASGRLRRCLLGDHVVWDDSYNANPASVAAGLAELSRQDGIRIAVLGEMGELGPAADDHHRTVGAEVARLGVALVAVGDRGEQLLAGFRAAGGRDGTHLAEIPAAVAHLRARLATGPSRLLVKASHAAGLERLVAGLVASHGTPSC